MPSSSNFLPQHFYSHDGAGGFTFEADLEGFDDHLDVVPERMTLPELQDYFSELSESLAGESDDAEILPIITGIVSALPAVVQGVSSLVQNFQRPRQAPARPAPPPPPSRPAYRPPTPAPRPIPRPVSVRPTPPPPVPAPTPPPPVPAVTPAAPPAASGQGSNATLATLLALLQSPALQTALQQPASSSNEVGNSGVPVSAVVDIIGQLTGALTGNEPATPPASEQYPDFLFDQEGYLLVNPDSPEAVGQLLLQKING